MPMHIGKTNALNKLKSKFE